MMISLFAATRRMAAAIAFTLLTVLSMAQPMDEAGKKSTKPYRILTAGKQITVKSTRNLQNIMVWTATGHRIIEQRGINNNSFTFSVNGTREKIFFVMLQYSEGKPYTEKIGIQ